MTGRGRGRGRSFVMREPDESEVDKIHQERASMNSKSEDSSSPKLEQFDDAASTTIGEGKIPPATKELKDALQSGIKVKEEVSSDSTRPLKKDTPLNPSVPPFVPSASNGVGGVTSKGAAPIYRKYVDSGNSSGGSHHSTSSSSSNTSQLNPDSKEFVPMSFLGNGVPPFLGNGDTSVLDDYEEVDQGWHNISDILRGFERAAPIETGDVTCEEVLAAGAEILLKVYSYPGSFEEIGRNFQEKLNAFRPSKAAFINLAEMFIYWGIKAPEVRYSSCRICHLISDFNVEKDEWFKFVLVDRLYDWHKKVNNVTETDEEKSTFVNFAGFLAEIYSKIEVQGEPVKFLGPLVFKYVGKLLNFGDEKFIREGCKILKLTGSNLMTVPRYQEEIDKITERLIELTLDKNLSQTCTQLLMQVQELIGTKWGVAPAPITVTTTASDYAKPSGTSNSKLNKDAPPFVPSGPLSEPYEFETVYNYQAAEQPVARREDWYDFVGDDDDNCDYTDGKDLDSKLASDSLEVEYDGLDPEIELEMEAFIDEIEEHLMLQDFDPDMHQNP